jgi:GDP-D-mannose 3', 5'-epimerase
MEQDVKVVVLGGGGFIGSHLVSFLKGKGYYVRAVDIDFPEIRREWWSKADNLKQFDLRDYDQVVKAISGYDHVYQLAADMGGVGFFSKHDYYPYIHNQQMNLNVLKACEELGVKRLFFSSSACIYPTHLQKDVNNPLRCSEDAIFPANSDQMYGWDKLMMTMLCERSPLDARVGIFHTIYGEGQEWEGERAKFPPTIAHKGIKALATNQIDIWGDGSQLRTFLYIDDAVEKIYEIMTTEYHGPVNVAGDQLVSVTETAKVVCSILGIDPKFNYQPAKPSGVMARDADQTKWYQYHTYRNKFTIKQGFERLISWLRH